VFASDFKVLLELLKHTAEQLHNGTEAQRDFAGGNETGDGGPLA